MPVVIKFRFGIVVTALVTSTKLSYVEPSLYWYWWLPLAGLPSQCFPAHWVWSSVHGSVQCVLNMVSATVGEATSSA